MPYVPAETEVEFEISDAKSKKAASPPPPPVAESSMAQTAVGIAMIAGGVYGYLNFHDSVQIQTASVTTALVGVSYLMKQGQSAPKK